MNSTAFDPGPLAEAGYGATDDRWTLVFVRDLRHPPEKVWAALTEPEQLRAWSPCTADRNLGSIGPATLTMIDSETSVSMPSMVSQAEPPTLLEYTWGPDALRFELAALDSGTRLTLRHTMKDRDALPKVAAGWHLCFVVAEHLLAGDPIQPIRGMDALNYGWEELQKRYAEKLAIPSTGGPEDAKR
jgi:uncharacterized protein YndB with AHSA1/START domain